MAKENKNDKKEEKGLEKKIVELTEEEKKTLKKKRKVEKLSEKEEVLLKSEKIKRREKRVKILKICLLILFIVLLIIYFILGVIYQQGSFTVTLDQNFAKKSGIILFENLDGENPRRILDAEKKEFMDNISINWLPENIDNEGDGSHNGENYIAYTFYIANQGDQTINYWYAILIDDVIRDVDKAIRVMIFKNGEKTIYAKARADGSSEGDTKSFYSDEFVLVEPRRDFAQGERDKFTIVVWIEGDDPDCVDYLIGGEMKMHMEITEEHKEGDGFEATIPNTKSREVQNAQTE